MGFVNLGGDLKTGLGAVNLNAAGMRVDTVVRPLAPFNPESHESLGTHGEIVMPALARNPVIEIDLYVLGNSQQRREAFRRIAGMIHDKDAVRLEFGDDGGRYYHVVPTGTVTPTDYIDSSFARLSFKSLYPWMFGETKQVEFGSSYVTFNVGGNTPTWFRTPDGSSQSGSTSSGVFIIGRNNTDRVRFVLSDSATSFSNFTIDFETRQASIDGSVAVPATNSRWYSLKPGSNKVSCNEYTTGTFTLEFTERWL